jgi:D-alanyl-lipoteichoic acid acyltransferase DltB (MBOAT superfamily)
MVFHSFSYLVFFPIVIAGFFIIPQKIKNLWLLTASYFFYMSWNCKYAILIVTSTIVTYLCAMFIEKANLHQARLAKKIYVAISLIINLATLFAFKYLSFFTININKLFLFFGSETTVPSLNLLLPVGISFYTFQVIAYILDVYRGKTKVEKNIITYALYVSFFPALVAGPIERANNLLTQLKQKYSFDFERVKSGLLLILWGFFLKLVLTERLAIVVNHVYSDYDKYVGFYLIIATVAFAFQIYTDFVAYSYIAMGSAQVIGIKLMENFNAPYFSTSISEFWHRWHISLSTWFRDYVYIPLGGNRHGKIKKYRNVLIVFILSGLWHGANWTFIIWGALNGVYQIIGSLPPPNQLLYK